jgi:hypothetical protein
MKKKFFDAMGEIGDDLLSEAHGTKKPVFVNWRKPLIAAACIALVAALGIGSAFMLTGAPSEEPSGGEYTSTVDSSPKKPQRYLVLSWGDLLGGKTDSDDVNEPVGGATMPDIAPPTEPMLPEYTKGEDGVLPSPVETDSSVEGEECLPVENDFYWYVPAKGGACEVIMITGVPSGTPFEEILTKYLDYCGYPLDVQYSAERVCEHTDVNGELVTLYPGVGVANVVLCGSREPDEFMYKCLVNTVISSTANSYVNIDYNGKNINIGGIAAPEGNAFFPLTEHRPQDVDITTEGELTGFLTTLPPEPEDSTIPNIGYDTDTPVSEIDPEAMECYYFIPQYGGYHPENAVASRKLDGIDFVAEFFYLSEIEDVKPVSVTFGQLNSGEINARVRLWMRDGVELGDLALKCLVNSIIKTYGCDTVSIYDYTGKTEKDLLINGEPAPYGAFDIENTDRTDAPDTTAASPYVPTPETTPSWGYEDTTPNWGYEETMYPLPDTTPVFPSYTIEDILPPAAGMTLYVPTDDGGVAIETVSSDVEYSSAEVLEIYIEKLSEGKVKVAYFAMGLSSKDEPQAKLDLKWGKLLNDTELKCIVNTVIDSFNVRYVKLFANGEDCYIDGVTFEDNKGFEWFEI